MKNLRQFALLISFTIFIMLVILVSGLTAGVRLQIAIFRSIIGGIFVSLFAYGIYFLFKNYLLTLFVQKYFKSQEWVSLNEEASDSVKTEDTVSLAEMKKDGSTETPSSTSNESQEKQVFTPLTDMASLKTTEAKENKV